VFSYPPDHQRPCSPRGVTHRHERMVRKLGIRTRLHLMRHYSATELLGVSTSVPSSGGSGTVSGARLPPKGGRGAPG
jgi:integrase